MTAASTSAPAAAASPLASWTTRELFAHKKKVYTLAWSCKGKLASGGNDGSIKIWSIEQAQVRLDTSGRATFPVVGGAGGPGLLEMRGQGAAVPCLASSCEL